MNSNLIMSEESVNRKRELIRTNREKRALMRLKKEQEEIDQREKIFELVKCCITTAQFAA